MISGDDVPLNATYPACHVAHVLPIKSVVKTEDKSTPMLRAGLDDVRYRKFESVEVTLANSGSPIPFPVTVSPVPPLSSIPLPVRL